MPDRAILTRDDLARLRAGRSASGLPAPGSFLVRSGVTAAPEPAADGSRRMTFVIRSGAAADRNGYRTNPKGWHTDNYLRNPVVLWAHDQTSLPLGRCTRLWTEGEQLKGEVEFTPEGELRFNDSVFNLLRGGFLNAVSAGWSPIDYEFVDLEDGGWEIAFSEQELMEFSIVPIPADPGALRQAADAGIDVGPVRAWAQKLLGEPRYIITAPDAVAASVERVKAVAEQFATFYPGAKALVLPDGYTIAPLPDTDTPALSTMTAAQLEAETAAIVAGPDPSNDPASTPAAVPTPEATSAGLPLDWYRVQLEHAQAEQEST